MCRRWPPLDRSVTRIREPIATIYSRLPASVQAAIRRTRVRMHPGDLTAEDWARRPGADAERYWGAVDQPHRQILLEQMRSFDSPKRFLELGSHSGPNLRLLARTFPEARVSGVEINGDVVEQARSFLRVDGIASVQFTVGSIVDVLPRLPSNSEDLVFSCYALAYTPPGQIGGALRDEGASGQPRTPVPRAACPGRPPLAVPARRSGGATTMRPRCAASGSRATQCEWSTRRALPRR